VPHKVTTSPLHQNPPTRNATANNIAHSYQIEINLNGNLKKSTLVLKHTTAICCSYMETRIDGKECNKQSYNIQHMIMTWWQICKVCGRRLLTVDLNTVVHLPTQNMRVSSLMVPTLTCGARVEFSSELAIIH
jgi:6-pyruvoyl-tetrahydropterin synthase